MKIAASLALLVGTLFSWHSGLAGASISSFASVPFGMGSLEVRYSPLMQQQALSRLDEAGIIDYYHRLLESDYIVLLGDLEYKKDSLLLNEWMFYTLTRSSVDAIFGRHKATDRELIVWFLMSHAGYDTRLGYNEEHVYLYLRSDEEVYGLPMIESRRKTYYYIPFPMVHPIQTEQVYLLPFDAMPGGKPLSFRWNSLPVLKYQPMHKQVEIRTSDTLYRMTVQYDLAWVNTLSQQPVLSDADYFDIPVSETLKATLYPQLARAIAGKPVRTALEIIAVFTRSSFDYQDDMKAYGRSRPMTPDEIFHYRYSDCEDRAILFAHLVRVLLQLPVIVIAFDDHITLGVGVNWECEASVVHAGRRYCICDPTGPPQSVELGVWPKGYENQSFAVISARP